jgi:hypothetical protein
MNPPDDLPPDLPAWIQTVIGNLNEYVEFTWKTDTAEDQFALRLEVIGRMNLTYSALASRITSELESRADIDPDVAGSAVRMAANLVVQSASTVAGFPENIVVHFLLL